jgi:hypothetical protein
MTPGTPRTQSGGAGEARNRRILAAKYLEVGELAATEEGPAANNVVVGICVLAGIAAGDVLCLFVQVRPRTCGDATARSTIPLGVSI